MNRESLSMNGVEYEPDYTLSWLRKTYGDLLLMEAFDQCGMTPHNSNPEILTEYCEEAEMATF